MSSKREREECLDAGLHAEAKEVEIQQEELLQVPVQDEHSELRLRMELEEQASEQASFSDLNERIKAANRENMHEANEATPELHPKPCLEDRASAEAGIDIPTNQEIYTDEDFTPGLYRTTVLEVKAYARPDRSSQCCAR